MASAEKVLHWGEFCGVLQKALVLFYTVFVVLTIQVILPSNWF